MKTFTIEKAKEILASKGSGMKSGAYKEAKSLILELIKENKGKVGGFEISPYDKDTAKLTEQEKEISRIWPDGMPVWFWAKIANEAKVRVILPTPIKISKTIKGVDGEVPRYLSASFIY